MRRIYYSSGNLLTGDRTAKAVLDYASALAKRETSDTIRIPIVTEEGSIGTAHMLVGPASQLMTVTADERAHEVDDEDTLIELERRTAGLLRPEGQPVAVEDLTEIEDDRPSYN